MHPLRKLYCRTFQLGLKIALPFLPYRKPKIQGSVKAIPGIMEKNHCKCAFIITDEGVRKLGLLSRLEHALSKHGISYFIYDQTVANPTTKNVAEALRLYQSQGCDALIGFGGGSSIDCAKAVGACIACPKKSLAKMKGILKVRRKLPLLIAIPTTAGTGSETTLAAVITDADTRYKYAINDFPLIPRYAVLDPKITLSLPPFLTATTGMDALTHAVEAYLGRSTTYGTRKDALLAVQLIFENLEKAYHDGSNLEARRKLLHASYYAGCAFTKSYVGYVHAVAHSLGGEYNIPHGLANAVLLPHILNAYGPHIHRKLKKLALAAGLVSRDTKKEEASRIFLDELHRLEDVFELPKTFPQIQKSDIRKLSRYADKEANPLYPVPLLLDAKELEQFYEIVMEESCNDRTGN